MKPYAKSYLDEVVETQGKLFDYVSQEYPQYDTASFIQSYMTSKTRQAIDEGQAYVCTMNPIELLNFYCDSENYKFKPGESIKGFVPDWIGEFYAYYQWFYNIPSKQLIDKIPVDYLIKAYPGLHDLDLDLAVKKVGE